MVVRGQLGCIGSLSQVLNCGVDSLVCIGFVTQVIIGGEGTVGCVSVL